LRNAILPEDCLLTHQKLRLCADLVQQGRSLKRRLAAADDGDITPFEDCELSNVGSVGYQRRGQGCQHRRDVRETGKARRHDYMSYGKPLAVGERNEKTADLMLYLRDIDRFDPVDVRFLEPIPVSCEMPDRARLECFQSTRPALVAEGRS
jgi:hypothetical protein